MGVAVIESPANHQEAWLIDTVARYAKPAELVCRRLVF